MKLAKIFLMIVLGVALVISGPAVAFARGGHGGHGGGHGGHSGGHHGGGHAGHSGRHHGGGHAGHFRGHFGHGVGIGLGYPWWYYRTYGYYPYNRYSGQDYCYDPQTRTYDLCCYDPQTRTYYRC